VPGTRLLGTEEAGSTHRWFRRPRQPPALAVSDRGRERHWSRKPERYGHGYGVCAEDRYLLLLGAQLKTVRNGDLVVLVVSTEEAAVLASCCNETLEALDEWEFDTKVGVSRAVVLDLRSGLADVLATPS
jgi:hypothetical protein